MKMLALTLCQLWLMTRLLNEYGIYIQPINAPTVKAGTERLRIAPTPFHDDIMMIQLVEALKQVLK